jgi:uncharacterized protein
MRIRSITCFFNPRIRATYATLDHLGKLTASARGLFSQSGQEVQTTRLATTPFPYLYPTEEVESAVRLAQTMEADAQERGFDYLSLGPALPSDLDSYKLIVPILKETKNVFLTGMMTAPRGDTSQHSELVMPAVRACAEIITQASSISPDGFANLRFGALANVGPYGPFFPAAYHLGDRPAFALAMECADVAYAAARKARTLAEARQNIITQLESQATALSSKANHLAKQFDVDFRGIDFSLAPFPSSGARWEPRWKPGTARIGHVWLAGGGGLPGRYAGPRLVDENRVQRHDDAGIGRFGAGGAHNRREPIPSTIC